jgi:ADP-ribose pyrophosphatase YjhB (NUDIX family)
MSRRYPPHPLLGVGALIFDGCRILLAERGREPLKGWWSLPGGLVETGETLRDAIRREVLEETGLEVEPSGVAEIFERIMRDEEGRAEYHYVLVDYICQITGGALEPGDDALRLAWVSADELSAYRITEGTVAVIEKALRQRGQ